MSGDTSRPPEELLKILAEAPEVPPVKQGEKGPKVISLTSDELEAEVRFELLKLFRDRTPFALSLSFEDEDGQLEVRNFYNGLSAGRFPEMLRRLKEFLDKHVPPGDAPLPRT